jgi:hypothetical protein
MRDRPREKPVPYWFWAGFVFWVVLYLDPLHDFVWNVVILAFTMFIGILLRSPVSLKMLSDANARLDQHHDEIKRRIR